MSKENKTKPTEEKIKDKAADGHSQGSVGLKSGTETKPKAKPRGRGQNKQGNLSKATANMSKKAKSKKIGAYNKLTVKLLAGKGKKVGSFKVEKTDSGSVTGSGTGSGDDADSLGGDGFKGQGRKSRPRSRSPRKGTFLARLKSLVNNPIVKKSLISQIEAGSVESGQSQPISDQVVPSDKTDAQPDEANQASSTGSQSRLNMFEKFAVNQMVDQNANSPKQTEQPQSQQAEGQGESERKSSQGKSQESKTAATQSTTQVESSPGTNNEISVVW